MIKVCLIPLLLYPRLVSSICCYIVTVKLFDLIQCSNILPAFYHVLVQWVLHKYLWEQVQYRSVNMLQQQLKHSRTQRHLVKERDNDFMVCEDRIQGKFKCSSIYESEVYAFSEMFKLQILTQIERGVNSRR